MAQASSIEWTESTWNPVTGCTKISTGCANCYAQRMAKRLKAMGQTRYRNGFSVTLQRDVLDLPLRWTRPRMIFVNSMSDLFHREVPIQYIVDCFAMMERAPQHTFQVLTKRRSVLRRWPSPCPGPRTFGSAQPSKTPITLGASRYSRGYRRQFDFFPSSRCWAQSQSFRWVASTG